MSEKRGIKSVKTFKSLREELGVSQETINELESSVRAESVFSPAVELETAAYDRAELIEAAKVDLNFLGALAIPDQFVCMFSATHLTAWQLLIDAERNSQQDKFPQIALGIPRGHAKTTLLKLFVLYCVLYTNRKFFLVVCSTEGHAVNFITDVCKMLAEDNIVNIFGDYRLGMESDVKNLKKFGFRGRNLVLFAVGAESSVRGANINNERPDIMIMDDIQTKENADSVLMSRALLEWMVGTLMKAKSPAGCMFLFAGNMFAARGSILRQLKTTRTWIKFISGAILADGTALWEERHSLTSLLKELDNDIAMGQPHIFFAEVLNDTDTGINNTVDYSKFPKWPWSGEDLPQGKFLIIDPSQGKGMDADVILTCEVYDEKIGVRAVHEDYYSPANLIRKALIIAIQSGVYCIAIESMAYQSTLLFWFDQVCTQLGISGISFVPIYNTMMSKNSRISAAIKAMQTHEIYLHDDVRSLVQKQIADWNPMKRDNKDDILDTIAHAMKVLAENTYDIMTRSNLVVLDGQSAEVREDNHAF